MDLAAFDYDLPADRIAQAPAVAREASRLLVIDRQRRRFADHRMAELPELLRPGDCMVVNDSRVIPARVLARAVPAEPRGSESGHPRSDPISRSDTVLPSRASIQC